jgi:hypothetical protein
LTNNVDRVLIAGGRMALGTVSVHVDSELRIVHLTITGALSRLGGLEYQRRMAVAIDHLAARRPWGVLSDRRNALVQSEEVQLIMADIFERATAAGRTHAAVLATSALTQMQMRRLALAGKLVQRHFESEIAAKAWLVRELKSG